MFFLLLSLSLCLPLPSVSLGDGKDIESSACLRLPSCSCAVGFRQRPDGHEERVLHWWLQKSGGLPQRKVGRTNSMCTPNVAFFVCFACCCLVDSDIDVHLLLLLPLYIPLGKCWKITKYCMNPVYYYVFGISGCMQVCLWVHHQNTFSHWCIYISERVLVDHDKLVWIR